VDIEKGAAFAEQIQALMQRSFTERVMPNPGGFGALFCLDYDEKLFRQNYAHPVLVSSTDGVGTKLKVAFRAGRHDTVGIDLVAMCANDILVQGAEPLFFLDYLATGKLEPEVFLQVVSGIVEGCKRAGCALLGGETAEMPDFYEPGHFDMAGFAVGVVERNRILTGQKVRPGHVAVGLPSNGLHSNGFTLVRHLFFQKEGMSCEDPLERWGIDRTLGEELLRPTRIYVRSVRAVLTRYRVKQVVAGIAHITGGGLLENIPRVLPADCGVELDKAAWEPPPIFQAIQELGDVPEEEMYRTFNMGLGLVLLVAPYYADSVVRQLRRQGEEPLVVGEVVRRPRQVIIS
jgi:phosphoribosylformylglycinamidine cyclo-ligase